MQPEDESTKAEISEQLAEEVLDFASLEMRIVESMGLDLAGLDLHEVTRKLYGGT